MKTTLAGLTLILASPAFGSQSAPWTLPPGLDYTAKQSTEAVLTFRHQVEFKSTRNPSPAEAKIKIEAQLLHLFGPMGVAATSAAPKGDDKITQITVAPKPNAPQTFVASYQYQGTVALENNRSSTYEIVLPVNPDTIYNEGTVVHWNQKTYPCTDDHYSSQGDFWYFWNPYKPGCPLKEGINFNRIKAEVRRLPHVDSSYPEYERLADAQGVIRITLLFGMDDPSNLRMPIASTDFNAENFRQTRNQLLRMGYLETVWSKERLRALLPPRTSPHPYVADYEFKGQKARIVVTLFFGPTGIDERSRAFHYFFKDAVENSSIMIYDGHSGLGGHLDLQSIEQIEGFKFQPHKNRYQIFFFNSCSSYTYYNSIFFDRKKSAADPKGTKNLDVLTNGLATNFDVMHESNMALIKAVHGWAVGRPRTSYQAMATVIDSDNLFGVNGDEDNPTR